MEEVVISQQQLPASFSVGFWFFLVVSALAGLCRVPESSPGAQGLL